MKGPNAAITPGQGSGAELVVPVPEATATRGELTPKPISPQPRPAMLL